MLTAALAEAHAVYGEASAIVLFVVQPSERNLVDQRLLEFALWEKYRIAVVRLTLEQVSYARAVPPQF
jgi:glutathione synthase